MSTVAPIPVAVTLDTHAGPAAMLKRIDPRTYVAVFASSAIWVSTISAWLPLVLWALVLLSAILFRPRSSQTQTIATGKMFMWLAGAAMITFMLYLIFAPGTGGARYDILGFNPEHEAVRLGSLMALRLIALMLLTFAFLSIVSPLELAAGATRVVLPLRRIGLPVMSSFYLAFFLIRMVPGLIDESRLIRMAQRSRGIGVHAGWFRSWRSSASLVVPIFASALRRSDQMALALASRGFNEDHVPLQVRRLRLGALDFAVLGAVIAGWVLWAYVRSW